MEYKGYNPEPTDILWQCFWGAIIGAVWHLPGAIIAVVTVLFVNWFFHFRRLDS